MKPLVQKVYMENIKNTRTPIMQVINKYFYIFGQIIWTSLKIRESRPNKKSKQYHQSGDLSEANCIYSLEMIRKVQ
jgi:hypothetical protein